MKRQLEKLSLKFIIGVVIAIFMLFGKDQSIAAYPYYTEGLTMWWYIALGCVMNWIYSK